MAAVLLGAGWLARAIASPAVADHLARRARSLGELERALAWDPGNPDLHLRAAALALGDLGGPDLAAARRHLALALGQRPTDGWSWLQWALLAEREGDRDRARAALATALGFDPYHVGLRWEAALLFLRWGEREAALAHLRYVLAVDPRQREAAFQLARALLPPGAPLADLLPEEPEALTGILATAVRRGDLALAQAAWERRAVVPPAIPEGLQRAYLDLLLREGQGGAARRLWLAMVPDGRPAGGNAVWNGGFEARRLLGWGLDWQVRRAWGVEVALDPFVAAEGRQSLRLAFNSFPTLEYAGVFQLVPVEPGREYRLRARLRAVDFVTRSGLRLEVATAGAGEPEVLGATEAVAGTTPDWVPVETRVRVPAGTSLVQVRLRREKATRPEGNLGGKVWVDDVRLVPASEARAAMGRPAAGARSSGVEDAPTGAPRQAPAAVRDSPGPSSGPAAARGAPPAERAASPAAARPPASAPPSWASAGA